MSDTRHLKRHSMPKSWPVMRKNVKYITRPRPGAQKREYAVSMVVLLRDVQGSVHNLREAKYALHNTEVLVNGRRVKDTKFSVSIFDIVEIKATGEKLRVLFDTYGKIKLVPTKDDLVISKVKKKSLAPGKKFQLGLFNGYTVFVDEKTFKNVKVEDTVSYDFTKKKIVEHLPLKEGSFVYIFDGNLRGNVGEVKAFVLYNGLARPYVS